MMAISTSTTSTIPSCTGDSIIEKENSDNNTILKISDHENIKKKMRHNIQCELVEDEDEQEDSDSPNLKEPSDVNSSTPDHNLPEKKSGRRELPSETVAILRQWMLSPDNICHPYPTENDKKMLMDKTGIDMKQLTNWFTNARKRIWKPLLAQELARRSQLQGDSLSATYGTVADPRLHGHPFPHRSMNNAQDSSYCYYQNYSQSVPYFSLFSGSHSLLLPPQQPPMRQGMLGPSSYTQQQSLRYSVPVPRNRTCSEPVLADVHGIYQSDSSVDRGHSRERKRSRMDIDNEIANTSSSRTSSSSFECLDNESDSEVTCKDMQQSEESTSSTGKKMESKAKKGKKNLLPLHKVQILKDWMMSPEHIMHPYPNEKEKKVLCEQTGIEMKQLTNWFTNNRKRYWRPQMDSIAMHNVSPSEVRGLHDNHFQKLPAIRRNTLASIPTWNEYNSPRSHTFPNVRSSLSKPLKSNSDGFQTFVPLSAQEMLSTSIHDRGMHKLPNSVPMLSPPRQFSSMSGRAPHFEPRNNRSNTLDMGAFLTSKGRMNIKDVISSINRNPDMFSEKQHPTKSLPSLSETLPLKLTKPKEIHQRKMVSRNHETTRCRAHSAQAMSLTNLMSLSHTTALPPVNENKRCMD